MPLKSCMYGFPSSSERASTALARTRRLRDPHGETLALDPGGRRFIIPGVVVGTPRVKDTLISLVDKS